MAKKATISRCWLPMLAAVGLCLVTAAAASDRSDCFMRTEKAAELFKAQRWDDSIFELREALALKALVDEATFDHVTNVANQLATALRQAGFHPPPDIDKYYDPSKPSESAKKTQKSSTDNGGGVDFDLAKTITNQAVAAVEKRLMAEMTMIEDAMSAQIKALQSRIKKLEAGAAASSIGEETAPTEQQPGHYSDEHEVEERDEM